MIFWLRQGIAEGRVAHVGFIADSEADVGRAYANLVSQSIVERRYEAVTGYLTDGTAYCNEHDLLSYGLYLQAWGARLELDRGRWSAARTLVLEVMGAGETSITLVAAAIGNAIFDATGVRIRQVPFTAERIKAALASRA